MKAVEAKWYVRFWGINCKNGALFNESGILDKLVAGLKHVYELLVCVLTPLCSGFRVTGLKRDRVTQRII
jgi:hypothetical protein